VSSSPDRFDGGGSDLGALPSYDGGPGTAPDENWYGRRGRLTPQRVADFEALYARYGLASATAVAAWHPQVLDIGFGSGESVVGLAEADPVARVLGVETFAPGVLALMRAIDAAGIDNVRVTRTNVTGLLPQLARGQLDLVRVFFPDPWPKRRHAARRLVRDGFVSRVSDLLAPGGVLHFATDIDAYAHDVGVLLQRFDELVPTPAPSRAVTRYEAQAVRAGRSVHDLAWRKSARP
jgi:tRNA (guanine-N7-)-methyltransferase